MATVVQFEEVQPGGQFWMEHLLERRMKLGSHYSCLAVRRDR
jgi:hypothetical protein